MNIDLTWEKHSDPAFKEGSAYSKEAVSINGLDMHAFAYRVHDVGPSSTQEPYIASYEEEVYRLQEQASGRLETTKLFGPKGGDWVIELVPYGD